MSQTGTVEGLELKETNGGKQYISVRINGETVNVWKTSFDGKQTKEWDLVSTLPGGARLSYDLSYNKEGKFPRFRHVEVVQNGATATQEAHTRAAPVRGYGPGPAIGGILKEVAEDARKAGKEEDFQWKSAQLVRYIQLYRLGESEFSKEPETPPGE